MQNSCLRYPGGHSSLVGLRAVRNVGTLFFPVSPRLAFCGAKRRPNPPVVCPGFGFDRLNSVPLFINLFSCEACTGIFVGTLVSSKEQSALAVRVVNQISTAGQTSISFLHFASFDIGFSEPPKMCRTTSSIRYLDGENRWRACLATQSQEGCFLDGENRWRACLATQSRSPCAATQCAAPNRLACINLT